MSNSLPLPLLRLKYEQAADEYCRSLPLEHYMEATPQSTQRKITLESLDLVHARRPDVQLFNELLVQYPLPSTDKLGQVVPDNMIVLSKKPLNPVGSYDLPLEGVLPYWVMEYVSPNSKRKDYDQSFHKYEQELKVPYCLMFYPEAQDLKLFRHRSGKYALVKPNARGRLPIARLDLELVLLDGWVRFWFKGALLPLPAELQHELDETRRQLEETVRQLDKERQARLALEEELSRLRAQRSRRRRG
jgi:Uma2 family endonuclease